MRELVQVLQREAERRLRSGDLKAADEVIQRLEHEDPLSAPTRGLRLEWLSRSGRVEEALAVARQLVELFPDSARIHSLAGQLFYGRKDYEAAERHFSESNKIHPFWRTRHLLGKTLTQLGRLEEAEGTLLLLVNEHVECCRDLAWLYERKGDVSRAVSFLERFLEGGREDATARSQLLRLKARLVPASDLVSEVENLVSLGEAIAPDLVPEYVDGLLRTGESARAREFVRANKAGFDAKTKARVGWVAYHRQAYDLALDLFVETFDAQSRSPKFMAALEAAARRMNQVSRLIALYEEKVGNDRRLYGRMLRLRRLL
jgi:tetratricopeptide (TPR) repeat protein